MNASSAQFGVEGVGGRVGMAPRGGNLIPLNAYSFSDSMYSTASPEPECCPSGGCYRNIPQGGFIWVFKVQTFWCCMKQFPFFFKGAVWSVNTPLHMNDVCSWRCVSMCLSLCMTVHPTPCPRPQPHISPCVPGGILSDRCLLPDAK